VHIAWTLNTQFKRCS